MERELTKIFKGLLCACLLGAFLSACVRYVVLDEDWPWAEDSFLPTDGGTLVTRVKLESYEQAVCESKSIAIAHEKLDLLVEKILESFRKEWIRDSLYNQYQGWYPDFAAQVKVLGRGKYEIYDLIGEEKKNTEECVATCSFKLKDLVDVIEESASLDSGFKQGILKTRFHQKLKSQVKQSS